MIRYILNSNSGLVVKACAGRRAYFGDDFVDLFDRHGLKRGKVGNGQVIAIDNTVEITLAGWIALRNAGAVNIVAIQCVG